MPCSSHITNQSALSSLDRNQQETKEWTFPTLLRILRSKVLILWPEAEKQGELGSGSLYIWLSWEGMRIELYNQVYFLKIHAFL